MKKQITEKVISFCRDRYGKEVSEVEKAQELIAAFGSMVGKDLAKEVSCQEAYKWTEGEWALGKGFVTPAEQPFHVVQIFQIS